MQWIVSSSVLILVVIALRYVLRGKLSLRMQYALWLLVLVRLLVPVSFGASDLSVMNAVPERAPTVQQGTYKQDIVGERNDAPANAGTVGIPAQSMSEAAPPDLVQNVTTATVTAPTVEKTDWARIAKTVWLAGAAALGLVFLAVNLRFGKKLRRSRERVEETDACLPVYESGETDTPCLFGVAKPSIYVTPDTRTEAETLRYALAHEQTHYRHGDNLWAVLRGVCLALHWYNPLVWWAAELSRRDAELACDEATIRRIGESERAAYGRTLIRISCERRATLLRTATTMNCGKRGLRERIALIAKRPKTAAYALVILILAAVAVTGCTFTGAQAGEPDLEGFIAENSGLTAGEGQYLAASYDLLSEEDSTYYVNCCITVFELAEDRTLAMADNVLTPMSLTLRRSGGDWTQETFWMPEDGDYNDPELEERFPQAALERLSELRTRSGLPLAMRCFEKAVPALDADVAAAIEPYLYKLEENGTTVEDASSTRNMAYDMIAFYGNCAVEYMQEQLKQPDISEERRLILNEAIAYIDILRDPEQTPPWSDLSLAELMSTITAEDIKYIACEVTGAVTAEQLAPALNAAAANQTALNASGQDTWYSLTAYLTDGRLELRAGLEENAVYVRYERSAGLREAVFEDSELYWLIRDSYSTSTNMEEVRYEEYRSVIEARAESTVQSAERYGGGPAFTGYELTLFELKDSF